MLMITYKLNGKLDDKHQVIKKVLEIVQKIVLKNSIEK